MKKIHLLLSLLVIATTSVASHAADSTSVRFPAGTDKPALVMQIPAGWTNAVTDGNLVVTGPGSIGVITCTLVADPDVSKITLDDLASQEFTAAGMKAIEKKEEATIVGIKGMAYYGTLVFPNGSVKVKIFLVKLDDTHVVSLSRVTNPAIKQPEMDAADKIISGATLAK